jgi:hypothetical protein
MIRILIFILALPINLIACSCGNFWGLVTIKDYNNSEFIISGKVAKVIIKKLYTDKDKLNFKLTKYLKEK